MKYGKKYENFLSHIKTCLGYIERRCKTILKTSEELALEIYADINETKEKSVSTTDHIINTIPISHHIIKQILNENNIDSSFVNEVIYNIELDGSENLLPNISENNVKFRGFGDHNNCKWIECTINNSEAIYHITLSSYIANSSCCEYDEKNFIKFDDKNEMSLLNFPILKSKIIPELGLESKHIPYDLIVDFDKTFAEYNDDKLKELGAFKNMKFLHMPELILNKEVCLFYFAR